VVCGLEFFGNPPLLEPPSYVKEMADLQARQEREPNQVLGVLAWLAQLSVTAGFILFCVLPAVLFVVVFFVILFTR
jgi:hypothetical protein